MKKQNEERIPKVEKEGWKAENLVEEASNADPEEIVEALREDDDDKKTAEGETGGCCGG